MSRRRAMIGNRARLPIAYQEVEYIKSTGTQYIDAGFAPTDETGAKLSFYKDFFSTETENQQAFFGALNDEGNRPFAFRLYNLNWQTYFVDASDPHSKSWVPFPITGSVEMNFKNSRTCQLEQNGQKIQFSLSSLTYEWDSNLWIFAQNVGDTHTVMWNARYCLKSMQITQGNDLIRDFVPCYRVSDNVAGLYDLVNDVFYTNAGEGTFIVGGNVN